MLGSVRLDKHIAFEQIQHRRNAETYELQSALHVMS